MSYVLANEDKDPLFEFIYKEYYGWIKECVKPRDVIMHYQDFGSAYIFDSETGAEHPIYLNEKKNEVEATSILYLQKYVD